MLFGSKLRGAFVLDTVFVVADSEPSKRMSGPLEPVDQWVDAVVFEPLRQATGPADETFRLYRGRTNDQTPSGPFSFVPCRPYRPHAAAFAHPILTLDRRWIEPNLAMGAKATVATEAEVRTVWETVVRQTVDVAGLACGIELGAPRGFGATSSQHTDPD